MGRTCTLVGLLIAALAPFLVLSTLGCASPRAPATRRTIPDTNINHCISLCTSAGLELQSIVIVANQTGCVCTVTDAPEQAAAASGGAVVVMIAQQQATANATHVR